HRRLSLYLEIDGGLERAPKPPRSERGVSILSAGPDAAGDARVLDDETVAVQRELGGEAGADALEAIAAALRPPGQAGVALTRDGHLEVGHGEVDDADLLAPARHHRQAADRQGIGEDGRRQVDVEATVERRPVRAVRPRPAAAAVARQRQHGAALAERPRLQRAHAPAGVTAERVAHGVGLAGAETDGDALGDDAAAVLDEPHRLQAGSRPRLPHHLALHAATRAGRARPRR